MIGRHPGLLHRFRWWFLRRTPEYRRCQRIADSWNHNTDLNVTPGQIWMLRRLRR